MPIRLLLALVLLIATPLLLLGWNLGIVLEARQADARRSAESVLMRRLTDASRRVDKQLRDYQLAYLTSCVAAIEERGKDAQQDALVQWVGEIRRSDPLVQTAFLLDPQQQLVYPAAPPQMDARRVSEYLGINEMTNGRPRGEAESNALTRDGYVARWMPWYREQGLQLVLWIECPDDSAVGILLNRSAWLSELIGNLPDSPSAQTETASSSKQSAAEPVGADSQVLNRATLVDAGEGLIYQWGEQSPAPPGPATNGETTASPWHRWVEIGLPPPLAAWKLRYEGTMPLSAQASALTPTMIALTGLAVLLVALGFYVATSLRRQMRLAQQQVSFAGQVSHELRTPLTNLRLYAEMAEGDLQKLPDSASRQSLQRRLAVIHQETQRLGRLCAGVLELVRRPHVGRAIRWEQLSPDQCLEELVHQYTPALHQQQMEIDTDFQSNDTVWLDRETLETVIINLLSNVEKYAADGERLSVSSWFAGQCLHVRVSDQGPGIARRFRQRIFRPFFRIDSSLQAPGGTGIGLSISRQRAESAGGQLVLVPTSQGASFELRLPFHRERP